MVLPHLNSGGIVICDRYMDSTLAYQQAQGITIAELLEMHKGFKVPDLTFIFNVPVEVLILRMKKDKVRTNEQKFEKNVEFIEKLRKNYLNLPLQIPERKFIIIDGTPSPEEIFQKQILPACESLFSQKS